MSSLHAVEAQNARENRDENEVVPYNLPDPLVTEKGLNVDSARMWNRTRRPELMKQFETQVYGKTPTPPHPIKPTYELTSEKDDALGGKAVRREVTIRFTDQPNGPHMDLLIFIPKSATKDKPAPAFLGLNFEGNQTASTDPGVKVSKAWMRPQSGAGIENHKATEATRGAQASRWMAERVVERGYALATAYYGDLDPDFDDGFQNGVQPLFYKEGQTKPEADEWGAIGAWAWGLSRALDYLETTPEIDSKKVVVMGHSRLGKTALWAGAQDQRFAMVISNNSGAGGAALSMRIFGETAAQLNRNFPHWFCKNFHQYSNHEERLPVDQHELIALIAPRPVLVCSAEEDLHADPKGEFLAAKAADPVYRLLGTDGLALDEFPKPAEDSLAKSTLGYRLRPGKHDVLPSDWEAYLDFADVHLRK